MHEVKDENGNMIHSHTHHHHNEGEHTTDAVKETTALMTYMVDHNKHHTDELVEMVQKLTELGKTEVAETMQQGIAKFSEGNEFLAKALELLSK